MVVGGDGLWGGKEGGVVVVWKEKRWVCGDGFLWICEGRGRF